LFVIRRRNGTWDRILCKNRKTRVYDIAAYLILTVNLSINIYLTYTESHNISHIIFRHVILIFIHSFYLVSLLFVVICKQLSDQTKHQIRLLKESKVVLKNAVCAHRQIVEDVNFIVKSNEFFIFLQIASTTLQYIHCALCCPLAD